MPKLNEATRKNILNARNAYSRGFEHWDQSLKVNGIGKAVLLQIMIYCKSPSTAPLADVPGPELDELALEKLVADEHGDTSGTVSMCALAVPKLDVSMEREVT